MFWDKLTPDESDQYYSLIKLTRPWFAWCSLSNTKKQDIPEPLPIPTDSQLIEMETLAMKGWEMI